MIKDERQRLLAETCHDLRQPVTALGLLLNVLQMARNWQEVGSVVARMKPALHQLSASIDALPQQLGSSLESVPSGAELRAGPAERPSLGLLAGVRVAILDDHADVRDSMVLALSSVGAVAQGFADAGALEAWLDQPGTHDHQALIADVHLGEVSGWTVLNQLKRGRPRLQVVVISGAASVGLSEAMVHAGWSFRRKPVELADLCRLLSAARQGGQPTH